MKSVSIKSPLLLILAIILVVLINSCEKPEDCRTCTARYSLGTVTKELCSEQARQAFETEHQGAEVDCQ